MSEKEDFVLEVFLDFLNAVEAGIATVKQRVKEQKGLWNPDKIKWTVAQGAKGEYERSEDTDNPEFKAMIKDLSVHGGRLTREGYFYWIFTNSKTVGRKKVKQ